MIFKSSLFLAIVTTFSVNLSAHAENKQCELIAGLTGDYYAQRLEGKSQQELEAETPSEFANLDFIRTIELARNLAFSFADDKTEKEVEDTVFAACIKHQ